ncbi:hypothetical protein U9M48_007475 [Paspalum notatum var. saurae]|uniref:ARM repeat superfamily protein n=1 Tax=Paspalum notatum var. saurae TaxID=547442 RepID=A0AAQ3SKD3_PASNO
MKYQKGRDASNGDRSQNGGGGDVPPSIRLDIIEQPGAGGLDTGGGGSVPLPTPLMYTRTPGTGRPSGGGGSSGRSDPPEKQLTLFALRLALLEKAASGIGKLDFVWATVVLLGGFVSSLNVTDFWCITFILVGEGARVFSRSHELEWQHHSTETSTAGGALRHGTRIFSRIWHALVDHSHHTAEAAAAGGRDAPAVFRPSNNEPESHQHQKVMQTPKASGRLFRRIVHALTVTDPVAAAAVGGGGDVSGDASTSTTQAQFHDMIAALREKRTGHAPNVPLLPYTGKVFAARTVGRLLNLLQVLSALTCVALSLMRLWKHDFNDVGDGDPTGSSSYRNKRPALLLFYSLALLEALLFLLEQAYRKWKFSYCRLIKKVTKDCHLGPYGHVSLKRFFYDAYSRCIDGSIFDGIKMDLVTFAEELILSDFLDEQLIGVSILEQFATNKRSQQGDTDTLRKVGTSPRSVERLVEMLNWKRPDEKEVRLSAALVVSKLAGKSQNVLRLSGIPGAIESVMSLLCTAQSAPVSSSGKYEDGYDYHTFNLLGLLILKKLAKDPDNRGKMGNARGLLAKIIDFTKASEGVLRNPNAPDSQVRTVKRALQVVKLLVSTTGNTGKALREGVAENVFTVSNLRGILRYGAVHGELQTLAIDVLTRLAMEHKGEQAIMATGGLVELLLSIFIGAKDKELGPKASGALAMLALENETGCAAILRRADVVRQLVSVLQQDGDESRRLNAARLLRNLCASSGPEHRERLRAVTMALPAVLTVTMEGKDTVLEACVGLTTQICSFIDGELFAAELRGAGVEERAYVQRLAAILREYKYPQVNVPRMRRFVVQQAIWLMTTSGGGRYTALLREVGMKGLLERGPSIADTTSELEYYHVFSGGVGIGRHHESMGAIICSALELITGGGGGGGGGGGAQAQAQGP